MMYKNAVESLLRALYSGLLYLLLPITVYHLMWRGLRTRQYLQRWGERYARYEGVSAHPQIWLHAVSVGEVNAAAPIVNALRARHPELRWVITTITPTGSDRVRALWGSSVEHVYLPYDVPGCVERFLTHFQPRIALILETELWPNLLFGCRDHGVPVYVLNARLSGRSLRGYRLLGPLIGRALRTVTHVAAQSAEDAARFIQLGAVPGQVSALGNLKFDIATPDGTQLARQFADALGGARSVWIAASTHEGEESAVVMLHQHLQKRFPGLVLIWVPRHPERFSAVEALCRDQGWQVQTRSRQSLPSAGTDVFVVDTLGELMGFYACADVAFVAGSLQPIGGHNLLEPAAMGTAVVTGPHLHNFSEISRRMREAGALRTGRDVAGVEEELAQLLADPSQRQAMVTAGRQLVANGKGAVDRIQTLITAHLPSPD